MTTLRSTGMQEIETYADLENNLVLVWFGFDNNTCLLE